METTKLDERIDKIIKDIKGLKVATFDEVLNEDEEQPLLNCIEIDTGVFAYNGGEDKFIIQDLYTEDIKTCNTTYLIEYLKEHL